jgi:hypothetical protein
VAAARAAAPLERSEVSFIVSTGNGFIGNYLLQKGFDNEPTRKPRVHRSSQAHHVAPEETTPWKREVRRIVGFACGPGGVALTAGADLQRLAR